MIDFALGCASGGVAGAVGLALLDHYRSWGEMRPSDKTSTDHTGKQIHRSKDANP